LFIHHEIKQETGHEYPFVKRVLRGETGFYFSNWEFFSRSDKDPFGFF